MNRSDSGFRAAGKSEQARVIDGLRVVRSVVGLIFLLIAAGLTAAQRMRSEAHAPMVTAHQPYTSVNGADTASRSMPSLRSNRATAIQSEAKADQSPPARKPGG